jgi:hypothetical protein
LQNKKTSLSNTRSTFNTFRTAIEKLTDMKFGGTFDLFGNFAGRLRLDFMAFGR